MKLGSVILLLAPVAALACGPFFYSAPPTLDAYPERLPGKTARQLVREARPAGAGEMTFAELNAEVRALADSLPKLPPAQARDRLTAARQHNRSGQYRKRFANALLDFEDLVADGGTKERGLADYLTERLDDMEWDNGILHRRLADDALVFDNISVEEHQRKWDAALGEKEKWLAAGAQAASPVLRPHWLVLSGGWEFRHARFEQARAFFEEVVRTAPRHPRAEIAQLMLVRVALEMNEELPQEKRSREDDLKVDAAFDAFTAAWPQSRFTLDLPLWRAGWSRARGSLGEAIRLLIEPLSASDHPEIVERAARELDACLASWEEDKHGDLDPENRLPVESLARNPLAALAVTYHFLDSASQKHLVGLEDDGDEDILKANLLPMLQVRREGRSVLPALARALGFQPPESRAPWKTSYLAVLAWASTQAGDHRQAIQTCKLAGEARRSSDDLAFVEAVALQRVGDLEQAEAAFSAFRSQFPLSPLGGEVTYRLSTVLREQHKEAAAIGELAALLGTSTPEPPDPSTESIGGAQLPPTPQPALHLDSEYRQWLDHLLHFAPLPQLELALSKKPADSDWAECLRQMLRWRSLAQENFASASRYAPPSTNAPPSDDPKDDGHIELTGEAWKAAVAKLEEEQKQISGTAQAKTEAELALAESWAALRHQFTWPRRVYQNIAGYQQNLHDFDRLATNASFAGISRPAIIAELESRDELLHAIPHWLAAAAASPGTPSSAKALGRANDALLLLAQCSSWHQGRAFETNAGSRSRAFYDQLHKQNPASLEAQRAIWWTFPPLFEFHSYEGPDYELEKNVLLAFHPPSGAPGQERQESDAESHAEEARLALQDLASHAGEQDEKQLLAGLSKIRKAFLPWFKSADNAALLNDLDDLSLFLREPNLTPAARQTYFTLRLSRDPPNVDEPALQPWRDYLTFLALVRERGPVDPGTDRSDVRPMTIRMREFLQKFPRSHKREAALARLAIAAVRESHGHAGVVYSTIWDRSTVAISGAHPEKLAAAKDALSAYEREFPKGRYGAEMRFWSGVSEMDRGDFTHALPALVAALDSRSEPDLHLDAALNLAAFFMRVLEDPAIRPLWIAAMRASPAAQEKFFTFIHGNTPGVELLYLEDYLRANL